MTDDRRRVLRMRLGGTVAALALTGWSGTAAAQAPAAPTGLEDIVVTALRRPEPLQSVPMAVTALSAAQLATRGITAPLQTAPYVPNMLAASTPGLGSASAYYIRGVGSIETFATLDPAVGTFVDDVYLGRSNATDFGFFDIERLEVRRGPQDTLLGRNTTGGAVAVVLKQPGERFGGYLEVDYGAYDRWQLRASLDVPVSDIVAFKFSGYYQTDRGYTLNPLTGEGLNDRDGAGLRAAVRLGGSDGWSWNAAVAYTRNAGENLLNFDCDPASPGNCDGRFSTTGLSQAKPAFGSNRYAPAVVAGDKAQLPLGNVAKTILVSSNLQYAGERATISLITGVVDTRHDYALDFADGRGLPDLATPVPPVRGYPSGGYTTLNSSRFEQFTQEVKLTGKLFGDRVDYVVGAHFFRERNFSDVADLVNLGGAGLGSPTLLADRRVNDTADASAGYGELDLHATDRLTLTGGVRYTDEKATFAVRDDRAACQLLPLPAFCLDTANLAAGGVPTEQRTRQWSPRFVATWQQNADLMVYASATNGFRAGGWNARATDPAALLPFDPETAWSYELGVRSQWFDDRLRVNLTGFWVEVDKLQTPSASVVDGVPRFAAQNFADLRNKGVELEVAAQPLANLNLYASIGYQDANYVVDADVPDIDSYGIKSVAALQRECLAQLAAGKVPLGSGASNAVSCASGIVDANGDIATPVRTPNWSLAVGGTYDFAIPAAGIVISPTVNLIYRSAFETDTGNATIYTGSITSGFDGTVYPANPFGGGAVTGSRIGAAVLVNAQLALTTDDNNWTVAVECNNCLDKESGESSRFNYTYLNPPRTWTLRARRVF